MGNRFFVGRSPGKYQFTDSTSAITAIVNGYATPYDTLQAAAAAIGSDRGAIIVSADVAMSASVTIPSNVLLVIENDARITTTGYTLTLAGKMECGPVQCFAGSGTVTFTDKQDSRVTPFWFGAVNNGSTDDATPWAAAMATGAVYVDCRGLNAKIGSTLTITGGQTIDLEGTTITISSSSLTVFSATNVDGWAVTGPFKITGGGSTSGTAKGFSVSGGRNWRVTNYTADSIQGHAFYLQPGTSTSRSDHGYVQNLRAISCYRGWEDTPGTGAEYTTLESPYIKACTQEGMITTAGNVIVFGGQILECDVNVKLGNGSNHGHGAFVGTNINHATTYAIQATQVTNGYDFLGCHVYANNSSGGGAIYFDRCKGIRMLGGHIDCWIYNDKDGSSGQNLIVDAYCPGSYGDVIVTEGGTNPGKDELVMIGCTGPGAYKSGVTDSDPGQVYVLAQRDIGSTQSLTSATNTTLIWPTETFDRQKSYNNSSGVFTVPTAQAGTYRVTTTGVISGATVTADVNSIDVQINSTSSFIIFPTKYSSTKYGFNWSADMYLNAADTLKFVANFTGTTLVFGDATWRCSLSIQRIA